MGHVDVNAVSYLLPDGRPLLADVSLRVGEGGKVALVGPNGTGKTTLLRIIAGDLTGYDGAITRSGGLGVMRQFIGRGGAEEAQQETVRDLLLSVAPEPIRVAARAVDEGEVAVMEIDDEPAQLAYAQALADWGDVGGYEQETLWDVCTVAAIGIPFEQVQWRSVSTLSGGEQKRLVLESLLRGSEGVLLLDEPDNFLDVPTKRWLEEQLIASPKTVLFVSHDRELLDRVATRIATLEPGAAGSSCWVHAGRFGTYHQARADRNAKLEELRKRWDEEQAKLKALVIMYRQKAGYNSDMATRLQAAETRLRRFEEVGPPELVPFEQNVRMRLRGGRTAKRAVIAERLELTGPGVPSAGMSSSATGLGAPSAGMSSSATGLGAPPAGMLSSAGGGMKPFDLEVWYGERIAILGSNGSGKSHFLRLVAAGGSDPAPEHRPVGDVIPAPVSHTGVARLGSRVRPGWFAQNHEHPALTGRTLLEILHRGDEHRPGKPREEAAKALDRYELARASEQTFDSLSGGQQARFQILLLELSGATLLLLDEPTDNLDLHSAEALEEGLAAFDGTVLAVTHDRWFARGFDRYLVFGQDGTVYESAEPVWDEGRVRRAR